MLYTLRPILKSINSFNIAFLFLLLLIFFFPPSASANKNDSMVVPTNNDRAFVSIIQDGIAEINDVAVISGLAIKESLYLVADDLYLRYRIALDKEGIGLNPVADGNYRSGKNTNKNQLANGYSGDFLWQNSQSRTIVGSIQRFHNAIVMVTNFYNHPVIQSRMLDGVDVLSLGSTNAYTDFSDKIGFVSDKFYLGYTILSPSDSSLAFLKSFFIFQRP